MEEKSKITPPAPASEGGFDTEPHGSNPKKGGNGVYLIIAFATLIAIMAGYYFSASKLTMKDNQKNWQGQTQTNANIQNDLKATQSNLTTAMNKQADYDKQLASVSQNVASVQSSLAGAKTSADSAVTTATGSKSDIAALQNQLKTDEATIRSLTDSNSTLKSQADANKSDIATLKTQVATLMKPTTPTTTPTGGTTSNGVVVNVIGNPYYQGKPIISFLATPVSTTTVTNTNSQQFTFQISNVTNAVINSEQLAIGLSIYDSNGQPYTLPAGTQVTLGSPFGLGTPSVTWTPVSTGQANVLGFQNSVATGLFASLGQITLAVGQIQSITLNVTVTSGTTNAIPPVLMFIQVIPLPSV